MEVTPKLESEAPETMYDLCMQVADAIQNEPKNYYQGMWEMPVSKLCAIYPAFSEGCGTAFCRAGWMVNLATDARGYPGSLIASKARAMFEKAGIPRKDVIWLFSGVALSETRYRPGTQAYADEGAKGMRAFAEQHKDKLQAITVKECLNDDSVAD